MLINDYDKKLIKPVLCSDFATRKLAYAGFRELREIWNSKP